MVNNVIPNGHFHKKWHQFMVKTWVSAAHTPPRRRERIDTAWLPTPSSCTAPPLASRLRIHYSLIKFLAPQFNQPARKVRRRNGESFSTLDCDVLSRVDPAGIADPATVSFIEILGAIRGSRLCLRLCAEDSPSQLCVS